MKRSSTKKKKKREENAHAHTKNGIYIVILYSNRSDNNAAFQNSNIYEWKCDTQSIKPKQKKRIFFLHKLNC